MLYFIFGTSRQIKNKFPKIAYNNTIKNTH